MYALHIGNKNYSSWSLRPWLLMRARDIAFAERLTPFDDLDNSGTDVGEGFHTLVAMAVLAVAR